MREAKKYHVTDYLYGLTGALLVGVPIAIIIFI